ncbi:hypothetical protein R1flu_022946 [Riccia fluitans]|uniref:Uncharacterized protein n=1 Tax=Riccia fluitans TaxID=41844 RepID=A0ABD1XQN5_9MARC
MYTLQWRHLLSQPLDLQGVFTSALHAFRSPILLTHSISSEAGNQKRFWGRFIRFSGTRVLSVRYAYSGHQILQVLTSTVSSTWIRHVHQKFTDRNSRTDLMHSNMKSWNKDVWTKIQNAKR